MKNRYIVDDNDHRDTYLLRYEVFDTKLEAIESAFRTRKGARERAKILNSLPYPIRAKEFFKVLDQLRGVKQ